MQRWGQLIARRRWVVLVAGLLLTSLAAVWGLGVFGSLSGGGFDDPDSESTRAQAASIEAFGQTDADLLVLYTGADGLRADEPAFEHAVTDTVAALPAEYVVRAVTTYDGGVRAWSPRTPHRHWCRSPLSAPTSTSAPMPTTGSAATSTLQD